MRKPGTITAAFSLGSAALKECGGDVDTSALVQVVKKDRGRITVLRNEFIVF